MEWSDRLPLWLTEDVTWPVAWGLMAVAILGFFWYLTGRRTLLYLAACGLLLVAAVLYIETKFVTDKEVLVSSIYTMAEHVQNNNPDGIVKFVRENNQLLRDRIYDNMRQFRFTNCSVIGFRKIEIDTKDKIPRTAHVGFSVWASAVESSRLEMIQQGSVAVDLEFRKEGGRWTVEAYGYRPSNSPGQIDLIRH